MSGFVGLLTRNYKAVNPPNPPKGPDALRFGILGAANIAPSALIIPARSHPEVVIAAVAARDKTKAEAFAKKHGIPKHYGGTTGYQDLLNDHDIDVIYNPLPNGLHFEWTAKALAAGKHVLLEKPSTDVAQEMQTLCDIAERRGLVLLEAFHYLFHPAVQRVKGIVDSGDLGKLKSISAKLAIPGQMKAFNDDDIRFKYELGGGIMMDMGCYPMSAARYLTGAEPTSVTSASSTLFHRDARVDTGTTASMVFPNDVSADLMCSVKLPGWGPFGFLPSMPQVIVTARCEGGTVELYNFVGPWIYHSITISPTSGPKRTEKAYAFKQGKGEAWWSTYRYQLEAFVDKIKGRTPQTWVSAEFSVGNMAAIEKVYEKTTLGVRPASSYRLPA
ncbi:NAD(P)-binding protein [Rickenella mellea]|uniref:D-xylose 1-dehydrogenase (NADP(+), D-xylono-1,5-lactone-forming) n=1 Tax=Rickenella mellea TaxID=50990 RepID=A0A4Y7Q9L5_9AGAM|nr:NAD(P)-binding protein [Rickenella mellea]